MDDKGANRAVIDAYRIWLEANGHHSAHLIVGWFNLGAELGRAGCPSDAIAAYRNALVVQPDFYQAAVNLGLTLEAQGQPDAALEAWGKALQPGTARTALLNHRGRLLEAHGHLEDAERELRASLMVDPDQPDVIQHFVHLRQKACLWPVLADTIPDLLPAALRQHAGPLGALALTDRVSEQRQITAEWIERRTTPAAQRLSPAEGYQHDRIRIGYLSSDFCSHAMSYLIVELFENHDRSRFEVIGYCSSPEDGSAIRQRVLAAFDQVRIIRHLSDEQAARVIREDEIDILVDLNGLTAGARMQMLRYRPAPVQATYLGFIGPVPLPELDWMFCDDVVVPPAVAHEYHPAPLAIGPCYQANDSRRTIVPATRVEIGLPQDRFVFCCFSRHYKITEEMFGAWMTILHRTDPAVLWLAEDNQWSRRNLLAHAAAAGIGPERIKFANRTDPAHYIGRMAQADLFLDTFPYNAGTIASDAIRMGLPLLTLAGQSFASRMAAGLLTAVGAKQEIMRSIDDYIGTAVALANDRTAYEAFKSAGAGLGWQRTIGNISSFTAQSEAALAHIVVKPSSRSAQALQPAMADA